MNQWWQMWESHFTPAECEAIKEHALKLPTQQAVIGHGGDHKLDEGYRRSHVRWLQRHAPDWRWLCERMEYLFRVSNDNAFGFDLGYFKDLQFTEYDSAYKGKYDWHEDLIWTTTSPSQRKLSMVIQLTDPSSYTGGNLEVKELPPEQASLRAQGTVLVFPTFLSHRVTPVETGIRHSLVSWYVGPNFR